MRKKPQRNDPSPMREAPWRLVAAFLSLALLVGVGGAAAAQEPAIATRDRSDASLAPERSSVALAPHETAVLATYYEIDPIACKGMAEPVVAITQQPGVALLYLAHVERVESGPSHCTAVRVPAVQVMLRAGATPGAAPYAWQVRFQHYRAPVVVQGGVSVTTHARSAAPPHSGAPPH